jgi:hypothetical protein
MPSSAVPWQRLLTVEILQFSVLRSSCHSHPCRTLVNSLNPNCQLSTELVAISSQLSSAGLGSSLYSLVADPTENTAFNISSIAVGAFTDPFGLKRPFVYSPIVVLSLFVPRSLPSNGSVRHNILCAVYISVHFTGNHHFIQNIYS